LPSSVHLPARQPLRSGASFMTGRDADVDTCAGKAGGFLALEWQDGSGTGPLARRSFQLHSQLAEELDADTGYRRVRTLAVTCSAQPGKLRSQQQARCSMAVPQRLCGVEQHCGSPGAYGCRVAGVQAQKQSSAPLLARLTGSMAQSSRRRCVGCRLIVGAQ
jgi:hypothetical protein